MCDACSGQIKPLRVSECFLSSSYLFIIINHPCHVLCFFHTQRTGRCFPSAWFLNFRSQEKKRKKKETVKNEDTHNVPRSGTDPHIQVCACMRSLEQEPTGFTFPQALSCIGEKAPGTAKGDFTRARVLGELYTIGAKDLFRKLLWSKMLGWTRADLGHCAGLLSSTQTLFHPFGLLPPSNFSSAHKIYCVPNSFSDSFPIHRLCSFLLPDGSH